MFKKIQDLDFDHRAKPKTIVNLLKLSRTYRSMKKVKGKQKVEVASRNLENL